MSAEPDPTPLYEQGGPEVRLWLAAILQAQETARGVVQSTRISAKTPDQIPIVRERMIRQARECIDGPWLDWICGLLGLDVDAVREASR